MAGFAGLHPQAWARLTLRGSFRRSFVVHFHYSLIVLNRLLSTPSRDDAVTDPSPPHIANSAGETFTRLITAFTDAHLSLYLSFKMLLHICTDRALFDPFSLVDRAGNVRGFFDGTKPESLPRLLEAIGKLNATPVP